MKQTTLFFLLLLLLFCGSQESFAANLPAYLSQNVLVKGSVNKLFTVAIKDQDNLIFEDADFDLEEDLQNIDDSSDAISHNFLHPKYHNLKWYSSVARLSVIKFYYLKFYTISSAVFGHSSPIYIKQRVLRI